MRGVLPSADGRESRGPICEKTSDGLGEKHHEQNNGGRQRQDDQADGAGSLTHAARPPRQRVPDGQEQAGCGEEPLLVATRGCQQPTEAQDGGSADRETGTPVGAATSPIR
jgi:hypothetical protein